MAQVAPELNTAQRERQRALVTPREHGAWGILLVPLVTGGAVGLLNGGRVFPVLLFTVAVVALFWLRTPVESLLGNAPLRVQSLGERRHVLKVIFQLTLVAAVSLVALFWHGRNLPVLWFGLAAAAAFAAQISLKRLGRSARMASQIAGAFALTSTAPAAYLVVTGRLDRTALSLWFANWLFAGDQIHFVSLRIHAARAQGWHARFAAGRTFLVGQILLVGALLLASFSGFFPRWALLAFVPVLFRGTFWLWSKPQPIAVRRLGWTELAHAAAFAILLISGFRAGN